MKQKDYHLTVRVSGPVKTKFHRIARKYGTPSGVLRELVEAFIDNRLTVKPPQKRKENIYD